MVKKIGVVIILAFLLVGYFNLDRIKRYFSEDTRSINSKEVKLLLKSEPSLEHLADILYNEGVVKSKAMVLEYAKENGLESREFAAGKYIILSQTQLADLVNGFIKNESGHGNSEVKVNVDFNRCKTIEDVGMNISKCIQADSTSIVNHIIAVETLRKYGFTKEQVPAMFLPKRYKMYYDTDAEGFVAFMAEEFKRFWNEERKIKMKRIGLNSPSQVATVASIVYAEQSKQKDEWPIIAKLYLNRIHKGMRLESDPTFKYCWGDKLDGVERLLNVHKEIDCPYNTYKVNGLPPGPILLPPGDVIDAVLNPADVDYIFMCGKPGGVGHNFAVTNAEHEQNAAVYRRWLKDYLRNKNK